MIYLFKEFLVINEKKDCYLNRKVAKSMNGECIYIYLFLFIKYV